MAAKGLVTVHLVTFATEDYKRSAHLCVESAKRNGVDGATIIEPSGTPDWPSNERGFGHWRWKPQVILNRMNLPEGNFLPVLRDGDICIYSDAGVEFTNNVSHIIDRMDQDVFLFGNNYAHAHWCKRDTVQEIWPSKFWEPSLEYHSDKAVTWERFGKQVQASVIFFRVSDYTRKFVKEWLDWCLFEGGRLIDDSPSRLPNHPEFQEHRHDQAILTCLSYREGLRLHWWPAIYNDGQFTYQKLPEYNADTYPAIFHHHRRRNVDWERVA